MQWVALGLIVLHLIPVSYGAYCLYRKSRKTVMMWNEKTEQTEMWSERQVEKWAGRPRTDLEKKLNCFIETQGECDSLSPLSEIEKAEYLKKLTAVADAYKGISK